MDLCIVFIGKIRSEIQGESQAVCYCLFLVLFCPLSEKFIPCGRHSCVSWIPEAARMHSVVSRQTPHVSNFKFCFSCRKSHLLMSHAFSGCLPLVTECGRCIKLSHFGPMWDKLVSNTCSRHLFWLTSQFDFFFCPVLLTPLSFLRCWFLINMLHSRLLRICF